jgi:phage tail-like protein
VADGYYPPGAFYFEVSVLGPGETKSSRPAIDGAFQEVSGLERELEFEEVREGGENRFAHRLPKRGRHPNLVLKRGLVTIQSALAEWAEETLRSMFSRPITPKVVTVTLLSMPAGEGQAGQPLVWWTLYNAYPVKWTTAPLNSTEGAIAVETFELSYTWAERKGT